MTQTILRNRLILPGDRVVLGVSGGADSMAMAHLLLRFSRQFPPLALAIGCLDHGLRPESGQEVKKVETFAVQKGIPFFTAKAEILQQGKSGIEERARMARYAFLRNVAREFGATRIAVAHHADDQAETVLLHFLNGSGVLGLSGMPISRAISPGSSISLVRPLLEIRKEALLEYLQEQGIDWCEDRSNQDVRFFRNRLRLETIPFLKSQGHDCVPSLIQTAERFQKTAGYLQQTADIFFAQRQGWCPARPDLEKFFEFLFGAKVSTRFENKDLKTIDPALLPFFFRSLAFFFRLDSTSFRENQYRAFQSLLQQESGTLSFTNDLDVLKRNDSTWFVARKEVPFFLPQPLEIPGKVPLTEYCTIESSPFAPGLKGWESLKNDISLLRVALCADELSSPLQVRFWKEEDLIHPLGAPGHRKFSRVLSDLKVPQILRKKVVILADEQQNVVWAPGICLSHRYRITPRTEKIWTLECVGIEHVH